VRNFRDGSVISIFPPGKRLTGRDSSAFSG
jgi:hypothetical protein